MKQKVFVDTNILVYAYDLNSKKKLEISRNILREGQEFKHLSISTQVFSEFINVISNKLGYEFVLPKIEKVIDKLKFLKLTDVNLTIIKVAVTIMRKYKISFWDAQIIAAAKFANCEVVLSEDFSHHQQYSGVLVVNPFK